MAANVEQLSALERRVSMSVPVQDVDRQVEDRLKKMARNVKMAGFRPGKVPMKMVVQQYGPQVRSEVIGDAVNKAFTDVVKESNLRVAGQPRIVEVKGMALEAPFQPNTLYINNSDKPGFIGALGTLLGDAQINIATFHLGRESAGAEAIALVGVDQVLPAPVMAKLQALPQVRYAKLLRF